ncbi:MAG: DNA polymerase III subunit gamma/tau [Pseudomonadota bacterium]
MGYLVLARKYRPQTFEEVVQQEHVTRTLTNAIRSGRVAHAILFSGPRGTGKTTIARILAKAMNCVDGPTPAPCNVCRSCADIVAGSSADVFEIDGASNNGVEQIRDLRDNIRYLPAYSPHKIYIIDEVHMLSIGAFNALLKTLEEPPAHVLFFFATTEPNKIPVTILSRCQRYDLRRIDESSLVAHMKQLCQEECRDASAHSLALIAREAGGSMRDALSLLDQVLASTEGSITPATVLSMVGGVERDLVEKMALGLLQRDIAALLMLLDDAYQRGIDLKKLYADMISHLRDVMVVAMGRGGLPMLDAATGDVEQLTAAAAIVDVSTLHQVSRLLYDSHTTVRLAQNTRLACEMVFFQVCQVVPSVSVDTLIEKLDLLRTTIALPPGPNVGDDAVALPPSNRETPLSRPAPPRDPSPSSEPPAPSAHRSPAASAPEAKLHADATAPTPAEHHTGADVPGNDRERDAAWQACLDVMSRKHPSLAAQLRGSRLVRMDAGRMAVELVGNGFQLNMVKRPKNREVLQAFCTAYFNRPLSVDVTGDSHAADEQDQKKNKHQELRQEILAHPLVEDAMDIFNGELVDIKLLEEDDQ